jgi:hypothetical protein
MNLGGKMADSSVRSNTALTSLIPLSLFTQPGIDLNQLISQLISGPSNPSSALTPPQPIVSLTQLQSVLQLYNAQLKANLVELLNREYADFIGLANSLNGVEEIIETLSSKLRAQVSKELQAVTNHLNDAKEDLEGKLSERIDLFHKTNILNTLLKVPSTIQHIESLFKQLNQLEKLENPEDLENKQQNHSNNPNDSDAAFTFYTQLIDSTNLSVTLPSLHSKLAENCTLLEQISRALANLHINAELTADFALITQFQAKISALSDQITQQLSQHLIFLLNSSESSENHESSENSGEILRILRCFIYLNLISEAENVVRQHYVQPRVSKLLNPPQNSQFSAIFTQLMAFLNSKISIKLQEINNCYEFQQFSFLINSFLREIFAQLNSFSNSALFSAAIPTEFFHNFTIAQEFVRNVVNSWPNQAKITLNLSELHQFTKKFNLTIYCQIRFQQFSQNLNKIIDNLTKWLENYGGSAENSPNSVQLGLISALSQLLQDCYAENTFIPAASSKFLKFSLQLIARTGGELRVIAENIKKNHQSSEVQGNIGAITHADSNLLVELYKEAVLLVKNLENQYKLLISSKNQLSSTLVTELLAPSIEQSSCTATEVSSVLSDFLVSGAVKVLEESVLRIKSAYSLTNKAAPTQPSNYMEKLCAPLRNFHTNHNKDAQFNGLMSEVVGKISEVYGQRSEELLKLISDMETMLNKLKKNKVTANSTAAGGNNQFESDADKARHQLYLDLMEFGRFCRQELELPRNAEEIPQLQQLKLIAEGISNGGESNTGLAGN